MTPPEGAHVTKLKEWAASHDLLVCTSSGSQREPDNLVAICENERSPAIIRSTSLDSVDTAALYLIEKLARLGVLL